VIEQVFPFDPAPWVAVAVALACASLFTAHAIDAGYRYTAHRDDRASLELLVALTLTAAAMGLTLASFAPMIDAVGIADREDVRNIGFGVVAGALLVTGATMFLLDRTLGTRR
jgi:hypothetical protein